MMQYIAHTYEQYSQDEAKAFTNIKTKINFATEDIQDADYISKLLGTRTVRVSADSVSNQHQGYSDKVHQFIWYQESEMKNDVYDSVETPQLHPFIHPLSQRTALLEVLET